MADKPRLSGAALETIQLSPSDGETMIAISRAILSGHYSDKEFNEDFFIAFIAVEDESDHIILDGYGDFNTASARFMLTGSRLRDLLKISFGYHEIDARSNTKIYQAEIQELYKLHSDIFVKSLNKFRSYFKLDLR